MFLYSLAAEFGRRRHGHASHTQRSARRQGSVHRARHKQGRGGQVFFTRDRESDFDFRRGGRAHEGRSTFWGEVGKTVFRRDVFGRVRIHGRKRQIRVHCCWQTRAEGELYSSIYALLCLPKTKLFERIDFPLGPMVFQRETGERKIVPGVHQWRSSGAHHTRDRRRTQRNDRVRCRKRSGQMQLRVFA